MQATPKRRYRLNGATFAKTTYFTQVTRGRYGLQATTKRRYRLNGCYLRENTTELQQSYLCEDTADYRQVPTKVDLENFTVGSARKVVTSLK